MTTPPTSTPLEGSADKSSQTNNTASPQSITSTPCTCGAPTKKAWFSHCTKCKHQFHDNNRSDYSNICQSCFNILQEQKEQLAQGTPVTKACTGWCKRDGFYASYDEKKDKGTSDENGWETQGSD